MASCGRSSKNDATIIATPVSESVLSVPPGPTAAVQEPEPTVFQAPTVPTSPLPSPTPVLPPWPSSEIPGGTPVPAAPLVVCVPQAEFVDCYDELLDMNFSYPSFMGSIYYTELSQGGYSGYSYDYFFEDSRIGAAAGGRSRDFSQGRGGWFTDQYGFGGRTAQEICATQLGRICREVGRGIILSVLFPTAQWICGEAMIFVSIPSVLIIMDLPQHPLIHGFGFMSSIVSPETDAEFAELRDELYTEQSCSPEGQAAFDAQMEQLRLGLEMGTADVDIQRRFDAMVHLAESIRSPYVGDAPVAQPTVP